MALRFLAVASALAGIAAPGLSLAQKGGGDSRPALMDFGAGTLGAGGQAAIGAGLRLFQTAPGATVIAPQPVPAPTSMPTGKPAPTGAAQPVPATGKPSPLAAPAPAGSATAFTIDPAVSARVREQMLAAALPTSPNPEGLRQAVAAGVPWTEFDRLLRQHGYDPRDLADVVAAFYLIAWEVATGSDATGQPQGIAAVRGQARQMLAAMPEFARMGMAERQAAAETLAFHAMAIAARHHDLQAAGGGPAVMSFREEVAQAVAQQQGIDLRRFTLTPAGFQQR